MDKKKVIPFDSFTARYEEWFIKYKFAYWSELEAVGSLIPSGIGLEVGVGSGRFAKPLGIEYGIDPSIKMLKISKKLGLKVVKAIGENLPFKNKTFDFVLMITSICFLNDLRKTISEVKRVLKDKGFIIVGFIDKNSPIGRYYLENKEKSPFYKVANFYSTDELITTLKELNFSNFSFKQTIFKPYWELKSVDKIENGYGKGSFVVIKAQNLT